MTLTIAVDVQGGINPVPELIEGAVAAYRDLGEELGLELHGNAREIERHLRPGGVLGLPDACRIVDAPGVVAREDDPRTCIAKLRGGKTSLGSAVASVAEGRAAAAVSAANTAGQVIAARKYFKVLPGCTPAIASQIPTRNRGRCLMLDCGASRESSAEDLVAHARMGAAAACALFDLPVAKTKLLSNGHDPERASDLVKMAHNLLSARDGTLLRYAGLIRGYEVLKGMADVVVTDGHTGNIALTMMEGTAGYIMDAAEEEARDLKTAGPLWAALAAPFGLRLRARIDRHKFNGGPILGLDHLAVKSHGSANARGFKHAVIVAHTLARADLIGQIKDRLAVR